mgnify:FL=1
MVELTEAQRRVLASLDRYPMRAIKSRDDKHALYEMALSEPPLVHSVYDLPHGGAVGRITDAGRAALEQEERR